MASDRLAWAKEADHRKIKGRPWARIRDRILLRDHYTCRRCKRVYLPSQLACDHITPLSNGGTDKDNNLQALCFGLGTSMCHESKTIEDSGGKPRQAVGADGWPARA